MRNGNFFIPASLLIWPLLCSGPAFCFGIERGFFNGGSMLWQETETTYSTSFDSFSFEANRGDLSSGVGLNANAKPIMRLFAPSHSDLSEQTDQSYQRGNDLVGFFRFSHYVADCYWSLQRNEINRIELETVISLRSTLLTTTTIDFASLVQFDPGEISDGITSRDFRFNDFWIAFATHPQDSDAVVIHNSDSGLEFKISLDNMERGVIRRIRLLMTIGQGDFDMQTLNHTDERFANSPAPLTT